MWTGRWIVGWKMIGTMWGMAEWRILQMDTEEFDRTAGRLRESMPAGRYGVTSEQLASLRAIPHVTRRPPLNSKVQRQVVGLFAICALVISCVVVGIDR